MDLRAVVYLHWIVSTVTCQGVYQEVSEEPCDITLNINQTVELVCSTSNTDLTKYPNICSIDQILWRIRRLSKVSNIYTSNRLSIWESVSLYGKQDEGPKFREISILRIEHFRKDDIGRYECHVISTCDDVTSPVYFKAADLCYEDLIMGGARCALILSEDKACDKVFLDKRCDVECDTMATLYDGFDCAPPVPHCQIPQCSQYFMDGVCHRQCNSASCFWDGGDCISTPLALTHDALVLDFEQVHKLALHAENSPALASHKQMSRHFTKLLGGLVRVIPVRDHTRIALSQESDSKRQVDVTNNGPTNGKLVMLRLDNSLCENRCFSKSEHLARYLKVYNTWLSNWDADSYLPLITVIKYGRDQCTTTAKHSIHRKFQIFKTGDKQSDPSSNQNGDSWINDNLLLITCFLGATLIVMLSIAVTTILICIQREKQKHSQRKVYTNEVAKSWLFGVEV